MDLQALIRSASGQTPADLLLVGGQVVNVFSGEVLPADVAISGSRIVGVGGQHTARETVDLGGAFLAPGFIDAHVHIESSMVTPAEFARAVLPRGTTTVVTDPHEIANVFGLQGIRYMFENAKYGPLSMYVMASSCVPATEMETSGAVLHWYDMVSLKEDPWVLGLAEVMNYPGVIGCAEGVLDKLRVFDGRVIDGHCPSVTGNALQAYVAAGIGSDHECTTVEEAREKLRLGMTIFLREATVARNLKDLLPLVDATNHQRICLCTDDRVPSDLLDEGHIDFMVRTAIAEGVEPLIAIRMATLNTASYFGLHDRGAIAPGRRADLLVFDDLTAPRPRMVYRGGRLVARDGEMAVPRAEREAGRPGGRLRGSINVDWQGLDLTIPAGGRRARVIGVVPDQLVTESLVDEPPVVDGLARSDPSRDLLMMAVIERHEASGAVGKGFVRGVGLQRGAIASSVAHDHHNIVVIGVDTTSMMRAARRVGELRGGIAVAEGERVLADVPLPVAGLMSAEPLETVRAQLDGALAAARGLGSPLHDPFLTMSFLALEVIPSLKLTDQGLVDVERFELVPLWLEE